MIKCVNRGDLDTKKWDQCILNAKNSRLYGMSYYLDSVCSEYSWLGLIHNDYEAVMPLPLNKRIPFFTRIMLPHFAQQLGVFSPQSITAELINQFLQAIPTSFKDVYLQLNSENEVLPHPQYKVEERSNFVLSLDKPYTEIRANYSKNLKRNINKALKNELHLGEVNIEEFIPFYIANDTAEYTSQAKTKSILRSLLSSLTKQGIATIHAVRDDKENLLAGCVISKFKGRLTYLMAKSSAEGKEKRAMHFLLDRIIEKECASMDYLDFEGSDIPTIAEFFAYFGANNMPYKLVKYKKFPFTLFA